MWDVIVLIPDHCLSIYLVSKYNVGLETLLQAEFCGDTVYKFRTIIGKMIFLIISRNKCSLYKDWL